MKKNHHLHRQIHLCLIILLLLFCSSSQVFAAARVNVKNTRIKLSATKLTYNKKVQRPKVRVTYKGKVLKEKKNYIALAAAKSLIRFRLLGALYTGIC